MNTYAPGFESAFQALTRAGYVGTRLDLANSLATPEGFESTFNALRKRGYNGDKRKLIEQIGIDPYQRDSALKLDDIQESLVPETEGDGSTTVEDLLASAEQTRLTFMEGIFGPAQEGIDPDPEEAYYNRPVYKVVKDEAGEFTEVEMDYESKKKQSEQQAQYDYEDRERAALERIALRDQVTDLPITGTAEMDNPDGFVNYGVYRNAKKWMERHQLAPGSIYQGDRLDLLVEEIYDQMENSDLFLRGGVNKAQVRDVMLNSGLVVYDNVTAAETMRNSNINFYFHEDLGTDVLIGSKAATVPTFENDQGDIVPFYEGSLGKINDSYVPKTLDEAAEMAGVPVKIGTFEQAQEFYESLDRTLSEEEYLNVVGYFNARQQAFDAKQTKDAISKEISNLFLDYNQATTKEEREEIIKAMRSRESKYIKAFNESNAIIGIDRRAYDMPELIAQMNLDKMSKEVYDTLNRYYDSGEYLGKLMSRSLDDNPIFKQRTYNAIGGAFNGIMDWVDGINQLGKERWKEAQESGNPLAVVGMYPFAAYTGAAFGLDTPSSREYLAEKIGISPDTAPSFNELSAGIKQEQRLNYEGMTLEKIERGVFGQRAVDAEDGAVLFADMVADAIPQIISQIVVTAAAPEAQLAYLASMGMSSAGSMYSDLEQNPNLTTGEKMLYSSLVGGAEFVSEKVFAKSEVASASAIRKAFGLDELTKGNKGLLWGAAKAEKGFLGAVNKAWKKGTNWKYFQFLEEGIEEGLVSIAEQNVKNMAERKALGREIEELDARLQTPGIDSDVAKSIRVSKAQKQGQIMDLEFSWREVADSFAVGIAAGGVQMGVVRAPSYVASKFRMRDHIKIRNEYAELKKRLQDGESLSKQEVTRMVELEDKMTRITVRDLAFYADMTEEEIIEIHGHNQTISTAIAKARKARVSLQEARKANDQDSVAVFEGMIQKAKQDVKQALEAKFAIEGKYTTNESYIEQSMLEDDVEAVLQEVGSTDPLITTYGRLTKGGAKTVEMDMDSAADLIEEIISEGKIKSTKFSSRVDIIRGLRNIPKIVATMKAKGGSGKVFLHGTQKAFKDATGQNISRGLFVNKENGDVHLFLPALKANTAYHEALHVATFRNENDDETRKGTRRFAQTLAKALPDPIRMARFLVASIGKQDLDNNPELAKLYNSLVSALELTEKGVNLNDAVRKALIDVVSESSTAADEFLTELLSIITEGDYDIEFKRGMLGALMDFIRPGFSKTKPPVMKDLVDAIKTATEKLAAGEALDDTGQITEAAARLKDARPQTAPEEGDQEKQPSWDTKAQDIEWQETPRQNMKNSGIAQRTIAVQDAAFKLAKGQITNEEYRQVVVDNSPITRIGRFFRGASQERMETDLRGKKKDKILAPLVADGKGKLAEGTPMTRVETRLDIPAYLDNNLWVVTIHEPGRGPVSYTSAVRLENVTFETDTRLALSVASKMMPKATFARMQGDVVPIPGNDATEIARNGEQMIEDIVDNPQWTQVGMNPFRHSFFWERSTGKPVVAADEVIQVGGLVYAKNPTFESIDSEKFTVFGELVEKGEDKFTIKASDQPLLDAEGKPVKFQRMDDRVVDGIDNQEAITDGPIELSSETFEAADKRQAIDVTNTYMGNRPAVDLVNLIKDFEEKEERSPKVWIWMGDQLKRGEYNNPKTGVTTTLLGGVGFSVAEDLATEDAVWASGLSMNTLTSRVEEADFIFIMAGSPRSGHNFSKGSIKTLFAEIESGMKRNIGKEFGGITIQDGSIQEFIQITNELLKEERKSKGKMVPVSETKKWSLVLKGLNEKGADLPNHPIRKSVVELMLHEGAGKKHGLKFHKFIHDDLGVPKQDRFNELIRDEYLAKIDAKYGDIVSVLKPTSVRENANDHDTYPNTIIGEFVGIPTSVYNVADIVPDSVLEQLAKEGADISKLSVPARIKTAAGDVGGIYTGENLQSIIGSIESISSDPATLRTVTNALSSLNASETNGERGAKQQAIEEMVGRAMYESEQPIQMYKLKVSGRKGKRKISLVETNEIGVHYYKKDIIDMLKSSGMSAKDAERVYQGAKAYMKGAKYGRVRPAKIAKEREREISKMSTEAKNLRKELQSLKDKTKNLNQFIREARALIKARMGKDAKTSKSFTKSQVDEFFKIMGMVTRTSAKKINDNPDKVIDSFIDRISKIFDAQDQKAVMEQYIQDIKEAAKLQAKAKKKAGGKDFGSYRRVAELAASIDPRMIPVSEMSGFIETLKLLNSSMGKAKVNKSGPVPLLMPSALAEVTKLLSTFSNYKAIEAAEIDASLRARAQKIVDDAKKKGKNLNFEDEYRKLLQAQGDRRLSTTEKDIRRYAVKMGKDPNQVEDLEEILLAIAKDQAESQQLRKELLIDEGILPKLFVHASELLENRMFAQIFGVSDPANLNADELRARLSRLENHHLAAIEYKMTDYVVNGSRNGLGSIAALVRGKIDYADATKGLNVQSRALGALLKLGKIFDNLPSFINAAFRTTNMKKAALRVSLGIQDIIMGVNKHEQRYLEIAEALEQEISRINKEYGLKGDQRIGSDFADAIMQIYSISRQPGDKTNAQHFISMRDALVNTIDENDKKESLDVVVREAQRAAVEELMEAGSIEALQNLVESKYSHMVEMVDFMVSMHEIMRPELERFTEEYLGKELDVIENYTHIRVLKSVGNELVDDVMDIRKKLIERQGLAAGANYKKIPGATIERAPRSLKSDTVLSLSFIELNHNTMRENSFITNTIGAVMAYKYGKETEGVDGIFKDGVKEALDQMVDNYLMAESTSGLGIFKAEIPVNIRWKGKGKKISLPNPVEMLRFSATILAFGSAIITQGVKQSTAFLDAVIHMRSPEALMYIIQEVLSNIGNTFISRNEDGKFTILNNPKAKLETDKFNLLRLSSVFLRDYESANIDPFSGKVRFVKPWWMKARELGSDTSLWTLKTTDKVVAMSSWFGFYADYMKQEGLVDNIRDINWGEQSNSPNKDALAYADMMVERAQNVSSGRMATEMFATSGEKGRGVKDGFSRIFASIIMPFTSFAINRKRSVVAAFGQLREKESRMEGVKGLTSFAVETYTFHILGKLIYAMFAKLASDDEDKEFGEYLPENMWRDAGIQTLIDGLPTPPIGKIEDSAKNLINRHVLFSESDYDIPGLTIEEKYNLFKRYGAAIPTYSTGIREAYNPEASALRSTLDQAAQLLGPGGQKYQDMMMLVENIQRGGSSYVTRSGKVRYVRAESRGDFMMSQVMRLSMHALSFGGLSFKEFDYFAKGMDNVAIDSSLSSEEAAAAYDLIAASFTEDPDLKAAIEAVEGGVGLERLSNLVNKQIEEDISTVAKGTSVSKFKRALKPAIADEWLKRNMPIEHRKHIKEVSTLANMSAKNIAAVLKAKRGLMTPEDYERYNTFVQLYIGIKSQQSLRSLLTELALSEQ